MHQQGEAASPPATHPHGLGLGCSLLGSSPPDATEQSRVSKTGQSGPWLVPSGSNWLFSLTGTSSQGGPLGPARAHVGHLGPQADGQKVLAQWYKIGYSLLNCKLELLRANAQLSVERCVKGRALENIRDSGFQLSTRLYPSGGPGCCRSPGWQKKHCPPAGEEQRTQSARAGSQWPLSLAA